MINAISLLALFLSLIPAVLPITKVYKIQDGLPDSSIRTMIQDSRGSIWVGSGNGAAYFSDNEWKTYIGELNPVTGGIPSLFEDTKGRLWFGGIGVAHVFDGRDYTTFSIQEDMTLSGRLVFSLFEDRDENIWAATPGGAAKYDGKDWTSITEASGLSHNVVHDINQDKQGRLWFATRKGGLNIYDGSKWERWYPEKNCRKLLKDKQGNMWVGTNDGILKYDGDRWQVFEQGKTVLPMFHGDKNYIWCISRGVDILRIPVSGPGKNITYENACKDLANEIYHLQETELGSVWAGTDNGVVVFH